MVDIYSLPLTCEELVEHLDEKFRARCIAPNETLAEAHRLAGARDVVEYLLDLRDNPDKDPHILEESNVLRTDA